MNIYIYEDHHLAEYRNYGQVGAMGENARSDGNTIQVQARAIGAEDLVNLAAQLHEVRAEMRKRSVHSADADEEIGLIASAEKAAKVGDGSKAISILKGAGRVTLDVAKSVAAQLVAAAIEGKLST